MIILYPLEDYDGFITEADCTVYLTNNVPTAQIAEYIALSGTEREVLIRQATTLIKSKITLPDTLEDNLKNACAYLVNYSVSNVMTNSDDSNNLKVKDITGVIKKEWFSPTSANNSFPDIVDALLSGYGIVQDGTFSFMRA